MTCSTSAVLASLSARHGHRRFRRDRVAARLVPEARVKPVRLVTRVQAVELAMEGWGVWRDDLLGYSLSPVREYASGAAQLHFFSRRPRLLTAPAVIADSRMGEGERTRSGTLGLRI